LTVRAEGVPESLGTIFKIWTLNYGAKGSHLTLKQVYKNQYENEQSVHSVLLPRKVKVEELIKS